MGRQPKETKFWCQQKPRSFATGFKKISLKPDFIQFFFMILYTYIAPGQGLTTPWGWNFDVNRNILSLRSVVASLKKNLFEVWFYTILFMILYTYIAPGQGQTAPRGQSFDVKRNVVSFHSFVVSLKKCLWSLILCIFSFHDLIHVHSPRAGADNPRGQHFDVNRNALSLNPLLQVSKKSLWSLIL